MTDSGLLVFGQNGSPTSKDTAYDSRKARMQTSLIDTPPKLAIIDNLPGGTALVSVSGSILREVLLPPIKHNLPYTPEVFMYFYAKSYNNSITDTHAGRYIGGQFLFAGGSLTDVLTVEVDSKEVRIVHILDDGIFGGGYTSDAPSYLIRIKYYITSNDSHVSSYTGNI